MKMRGCVLERNIRDKVFFCTQLLHWQRFASSSQFYNQSIRKGFSSFFKGENWTDFACLLTAYLEVSHFLWVRCNFYPPWEWQALVFLMVCVLLFLTCLWTTRLFCFLFSASHLPACVKRVTSVVGNSHLPLWHLLVPKTEKVTL